MKKLYSILFCSLALAGCTAAAQPLTESILWQVGGNGLENPSYLLGTHHFAPVGILDEYPSFKKALGAVKQVVGELDMEDIGRSQMAAMQYGTMPEGITYRDLLSDENYQKLDNYLIGNFGAGLAQFGNFKPAMISTMYVAMAYMASDPSFNPVSHEPIDAYVQRLARQEGKKIRGLETIDRQMDLLMNSEPLEIQVQSLMCSLENDDMGVELLKELNELYKQGKLQAMHALSFNNPDDPCPGSEEFNHALVVKRNENWLCEIPAIFAEGPALIAVGALHLSGEEGLVNRLREMGYTVEPIR